jgi:hypothetical protein
VATPTPRQPDVHQANASFEPWKQIFHVFHAINISSQPTQSFADANIESLWFQHQTTEMPPGHRVSLESLRDDQFAFWREFRR